MFWEADFVLTSIFDVLSRAGHCFDVTCDQSMGSYTRDSTEGAASCYSFPTSSWYKAVLSETPEQQPKRLRSEDECRVAQSSFTSVEPRKCTVVKGAIEDLKGSVPHKLFNAARAHQWILQNYKIGTRVLHYQVLKDRPSPVSTCDQWLLGGCGGYQGYSRVMNNFILHLVQ